jgi:hypothetical protein
LHRVSICLGFFLVERIAVCTLCRSELRRRGIRGCQFFLRTTPLVSFICLSILRKVTLLCRAVVVQNMGESISKDSKDQYSPVSCSPSPVERRWESPPSVPNPDPDLYPARDRNLKPCKFMQAYGSRKFPHKVVLI